MKLTTRLVFCVIVFISSTSCATREVEWAGADETDHFTFFATQDSENAISLLKGELERNYDRINQDLQAAPAEKFSIYIFEDIDAFHKADGRPNASPESVGAVHGVDIWLISPLNPGNVLNTEEVLTSGVHEFTHALVNYINGSQDRNNYQTPTWLNEGLAEHEAGQMTPDWRARIAQRVDDGAIPLISNDLISERFEEAEGLPFSITLIEYIIQEYGIEKVIAMIKAPTEIEPILGVTISELDASGRQYLQYEYQ